MMIIYYRVPLLKYRLMFLRVLKVFDEPLAQSHTERRVKYQLVFQKKASNNIFAIKITKFCDKGVKI